jgi:hypothetical protein
MVILAQVVINYLLDINREKEEANMNMPTFFQELLSKITRFRKGLSKDKDNGRLSEVMQAYLVKEFKLLPENMADLRYVHSRNFVRVFNVAKAREQAIVIKKFRDLDKHRELSMYYGRVGPRGQCYLKRDWH